MKMILVSAFLICGAIVGYAASFQNLNFDAANTNNMISAGESQSHGTPSDMLPGWQVGPPSSGDPVNWVFLNLVPLGGNYISLYDANNRLNRPREDRVPTFGQFSFVLIPDFSVTLSLSQIGQIPAEANYIQFTSFGSPVDVLIGGHSIGLTRIPTPTIPNSSLPTFTVFGDISAYAGKEVQLEFLASGTLGVGGFSGLDNISFSAVPEPSMLALFACGAAAIFGNCFRRKKSERKTQGNLGLFVGVSAQQIRLG